MSKTAGEVDYEREVAALDAVSPATHPARDAAGFRRIIAARKAIDAAEADLLETVRAARAAGDSWTVVGAALGQSRQAAHRRFAHQLGEEPPRAAESSMTVLESAVLASRLLAERLASGEDFMAAVADAVARNVATAGVGVPLDVVEVNVDAVDVPGLLADVRQQPDLAVHLILTAPAGFLPHRVTD